MGGSGLVTPQQAAGMGGAGKPAGAQADNTFQSKELRHLVMMVRYTPAPVDNTAFGDMTSTANLIGGVTGKVEGAVNTVETAMSGIPGLDMFIKEKKTDSTSQKEYSYTYSDWDTRFGQVKSNMQQVNSNSKTDLFEFHSADAQGRKADAQNLFSKVNGTISGWDGYPVQIHFIGIGQGGHVVNECTDLLAKDGGFAGQPKCFVKSVIYAGAALYKNEHLLNEAAFKRQGRVFAFASNFDLTQHAVDYFEPNDKLVQLIKDSNKNTLSLPVGKVKLRVIKILSLVLGGMNLGIGHTGDLNKIDLVKNEITGMIDDIVGMLKELATSTAAFIKLGKLPEFSKMMDGLGAIPGQCKDELDRFLKDFSKEALHQAEHANVSLGPQDLAGALNCFCPLLDHITASFALFKYEEKTGADVAGQMMENAGVKTVYAPADQAYEDQSPSDPYYSKFIHKINDPKPDLATAYMTQARSLIAQAAENGSDSSKFGEEEKIAVAESIFLMARPMTLSKEEVYKELLTMVDSFANFDSLSKNITTNKLTDIPAGPLQSINVHYPPKLQDSIARNNDEITRIKGFFNKNNFGLQDDSQYFVFNSHNLLFNKMPEAVAFCIDTQTGIVESQKQAGMDNEFPITGNNKYNPSGSKQKENVLPAQPLPAADGGGQ